MATKIIRIQCDKSSIFNNLKQSLAQRFKQIQQPNISISILWQDNEQEWITIDDQEGLLLAMEEMGGPVYKIKVIYEIQALTGKNSSV